MLSTHRKILGSVGEILAAKFVLLGLTFASNILISRILGPEGRGEVALAIAIGLTLLQFSFLGIDYINNYGIAKQRSRLDVFLSNSLTLSLLWVPIIAIILTLVPFIPEGMINIAPQSLILVILPLPLLLLSQYMGALLLGLQAQREYNVSELTGQTAQFIYLLFLIYTKTVSVSAILLTLLLLAIFTLGPQLYFLRRHGARLIKPDFREWWTLARYSVQQYIEQFLAFVIFRIDIFMVTAFMGIVSTGNYAVAVTWANLLMILPQSLGRVLFPHITQAQNYQQSRDLTIKMATMTGWGMLAICFGIAATAHIFIPLLYGAAFAPATWGLLALLPGIWMWSVESILRKLIVAYNYKTNVTYSWFVACGTNIGLNLILIPKIGIAGAGLAFSGSMLALLLMTIYLFKIHQDNPNAA